MSAWFFRTLALVALKYHFDRVAEWAMKKHRASTGKDFK